MHAVGDFVRIADHPEATGCMGTISEFKAKTEKVVVTVMVPQFWGSEPIKIECSVADLVVLVERPESGAGGTIGSPNVKRIEAHS